MRHDKHEPEAETIISDAAARFTVVLSLALFTIGAALLIWRGLSPVPEGDHWIDQVMGAISAFSTFAAMLLILYLFFAAKVYADRQVEQLRLAFRQAWRKATNRLLSDLGRKPPTCGRLGPSGRSWLNPPAWRGDQSMSPPVPEAPGVGAASSLWTLNSMTDQDDLPGMGRRDSTSCATPDRPSPFGREV